MAEIVASWLTPGNAPLVSPANTPTIRIRRLDTDALVVTDDAMSEVGDGSYQYTFATDPTLEYSIRADGDPTAAGQVSAETRYVFGSLSGIDIETMDRTLAIIEGGRDIDFTGNDLLGWQRIERDTSGTELRRYNLFDEGGARITGTVAAFLAAGKMISSEVAI